MFGDTISKIVSNEVSYFYKIKFDQSTPVADSTDIPETDIERNENPVVYIFWSLELTRQLTRIIGRFFKTILSQTVTHEEKTSKVDGLSAKCLYLKMQSGAVVHPPWNQH